MTPQEKVIDKLLDIPSITEESVFDALIKVNQEDTFQLSPCILAGMWNKSEAVKYGFAKGRTAADFS